MNLPNKLTVFRIILVPIMVIIPYLPINGEFIRNTNIIFNYGFNFYNSINYR